MDLTLEEKLNSIIEVTIYHIPSIGKVGCSKRYEQRVKENTEKYGDVEINVLQRFQGTVYECAELESEWSLKKGYGPIQSNQRYDSDQNLNNLFPSDASIRKMANTKRGQPSTLVHTPEFKKKQSIRMTENNPSKNGLKQSTKDLMSINRKGKAQPLVKCLKCHQSGGEYSMKQHHYKKCNGELVSMEPIEDTPSLFNILF